MQNDHILSACRPARNVLTRDKKGEHKTRLFYNIIELPHIESCLLAFCNTYLNLPFSTWTMKNKF